MTATTFKPGQSRATPSVLPPPRAPPKKISNTWHFSSRIWAGLPRGDQATLTSGSATRSIIAAYRARARWPRLPTSHCPSAPGFRSRNGALSPPHAIASAYHWSPVAVAHQPRADLVPAAHRAARWNAGVVGMAEPHLAAGPTGDALGDRRAAVLLERGRVEHAIGDVLAMLALGNALADFLGMKLQAHIGFAQPHPVPFPVTDHASTRQHPAVHGVIVLHNRPPADRERRG